MVSTYILYSRMFRIQVAISFLCFMLSLSFKAFSLCAAEDNIQIVCSSSGDGEGDCVGQVAQEEQEQEQEVQMSISFSEELVEDVDDEISSELDELIRLQVFPPSACILSH